MRNLFTEMSLKNRKNRLIFLAVVIFLLSVGASIVIRKPSGKQLVEVASDGQVLYTIDLSRERDRDILVHYGEESNLIRIENGTIRVVEATCPDHTCMKMGPLQSDYLPIVCLPHRLTIRYVQED